MRFDRQGFFQFALAENLDQTGGLFHQPGAGQLFGTDFALKVAGGEILYVEDLVNRFELVVYISRFRSP